MEPFAIFDIVRTYKPSEPLICVSATVVHETVKWWLLEVTAHTYGGFRRKSMVKRDSYARSEAEAWRLYAESERDIAREFRHQATAREAYAGIASQQVARLAGDNAADAA